MKPRVKFHQRNGASVYTLDGKPMDFEDEIHYGIEMRRARELYDHHREIVAALPYWLQKLCKRFRFKPVTQYL